MAKDKPSFPDRLITQALQFVRLVELDACLENIDVIFHRTGKSALFPEEKNLWEKIKKDRDRARRLGQDGPFHWPQPPVDTLAKLRQWCQSVCDACTVIKATGQRTIAAANVVWKARRLFHKIIDQRDPRPPPDTFEQATTLAKSKVDDVVKQVNDIIKLCDLGMELKKQG